ncbi:MAG: mandelate racemase/muconate lactonizing enzyme family protein [Chloroflexota bacterium]
MRITEVRTVAVEYRYAERPPMSGGGVNAARAALLVIVETDSGLTGIGESGVAGGPSISTKTVVDRELAPLVVGQDPFEVERLWRLMAVRTRQHGRRGLLMHAIAGIDMALWDLIGKALKQPLYRILGAYRDRVPAYASGGFFFEGKSTQDLAEECRRYREEGYGGVKIKIGRNRGDYALSPMEVSAGNDLCVTTPEEDLERIRASREAIGPNMKLMADVNCAWSAATATTMAKRMEPYNLFWLEEPITPEDVVGSAALAASTTVPIAGYETASGMGEYRALIDARAVDVVQVDLSWSGGITEARRIAAYAYAHHLPFAPHVFTSAVNVAASLHLAASIPNGTLFELDQNVNRLRTDLIANPFKIDGNGDIRVPDAPGLGIELNDDVVRELTIS